MTEQTDTQLAFDLRVDAAILAANNHPHMAAHLELAAQRLEAIAAMRDAVKLAFEAADAHRAQIAREIYAALERLGTDEEFLSIVGSWRDTLDEAEILALLREYNAGRATLHRPQ